MSSSRMRVAAATALGAAAVKAKMMADAEEREVQRQVQIAIEAQLQKVQLKLNSMTQLEDALERERSIMEVCLLELLLIMHFLLCQMQGHIALCKCTVANGPSLINQCLARDVLLSPIVAGDYRSCFVVSDLEQIFFGKWPFVHTC